MVHQNEVENGHRRVAIYCRVSTSDQDIDRQERDLKEKAQRADYEIVEVFRETLSGIRLSARVRVICRKVATTVVWRRPSELPARKSRRALTNRVVGCRGEVTVVSYTP